MANALDSADLTVPGAAAYGQSQPLPEFLMTVLRYLPFVAVLMAGAAGFMYTVTGPEAPRPTVSSQIGLTQEVVWPFYDAARQRAVTTLELPDFQEELNTRVESPEAFELAVDAPDNQAFLNIQVTGTTPEGAAEVANEAAALLLDRDRRRLASNAEADAEVAKAALEASIARSEETSRQLDALVPIEAAARASAADFPNSPQIREDVLRAELERSSLSQTLNEELRRQISLQIEFDETTATAAAVRPELEILKLASPPTVTAERSLIPVAAAALAAMVIGLGAAIAWDRSRGPLTTRWHAEQVAGVPVLADLGPRRTRDRAAGLFVTSLVDGAATDGNIIAVNGLPGVDLDEWIQMLVHQTEFIGISVVALSDPARGAVRHGVGNIRSWTELERASNRAELLRDTSTITMPESLTLLDATLMRNVLYDIAQYKQLVLVRGGITGGRESDAALTLADATVLIANRRGNRVDQLRRAASAVRNRRTKLLGVVLAGRELPAPVIPTTMHPSRPTTFDPTVTGQLN